MRAPLLALLVLLPGCFGSGEETQPPTGGAATPPAVEAGIPLAVANGTFEPTHWVGRSWTYEATQLYNPDTEFTVVVAEATPQGYLFAGGSDEDIVYEALWGSDWHGPMTRRLVEREGVNPFDWPLVDGKTWAYTERMQVKARAADVRTPLGTEPGFVIEGSNEHGTMRYEYAPSIGYYVSFQYEYNGRVFESLRLKSTGNATSFVWYELGPLTAVPDPTEPALVEVGEGWDNVIVSAGGSGGGRVAVVPPDRTTWTSEFPGEQAWRHAMLPPTAGRWSATVQGRPWLRDAPDLPDAPAPMGWGYMHLAPVKWTRGTLPSAG